MNSLNQDKLLSEQKGQIEDIINIIKNDIFTEDFQDIIEITYAYDTVQSNNQTYYFNKTLFTKFAEQEKDIPLEEIKKEVERKLYEQKNIIDQAINKLKNIENSDPRIDILKGTLNFAKDIITLTLLGLPFELEKAGLLHDMTYEQTIDRVKQMEHIEKKLFGGKVIDNSEEIQDAIQILTNKYTKRSKRISLEEKQYIETFLEKLKSLPALENVDMDIKKEKKHTNIFNKNSKLVNTLISREDYVCIFKTIFGLYNLDINVIIEEGRGSIYDGPNALHIPANKKYSHLSLGRILRLISHEIETHYVGDYNNQQILGVRGGNNLQREEGLAKLSEELLIGKDLSAITSSISILTTLAAEVLTQSEYIRFYQILEKLNKSGNILTFEEGEQSIITINDKPTKVEVIDTHKDTNGKISSVILQELGSTKKHILTTQEMQKGFLQLISNPEVTNQILRKKRNYPLYLPGGQHKDTSYPRGLKQMVKKVTEEQHPEDYYIGRVSFEDTPIAANIAKKHNINLKLPHYVSEMILYKLVSGELTKEKFHSYVDEKYNFINPESRQKVKELTYSQKKKLAEVLSIIKKNL